MYDIYHGLIPEDDCERARRRLFIELRRCGLDPAVVNEWTQATWWPSLRDAPEFYYVRDRLQEQIVDFDESSVWAETQILIRLPDEDRTEVGDPHRDDLPPWAIEQGLKYSSIWGVELTETPANGGGTVLYPDGIHNLSVKPQLGVGDVLRMDPTLLHSGSPNLSGDIRVVLFFRLLEPA